MTSIPTLLMLAVMLRNLVLVKRGKLLLMQMRWLLGVVLLEMDRR